MDTRLSSPRVPIPPPLLFGVALGLGILLEHFMSVPLEIPPVTPFLRILGTILAACSGGLAASAFLTLAHHSTTFRTDRTTSHLVVSGPFRFTRNPLYLSLVLLVAGVGLIANTAWPLALLIPTAIVVQRTAIVPEERLLLQRYGHEYEQYCHQVRRWL